MIVKEGYSQDHKDFKVYRKQIVKVAKDLFYDDDVIARVSNAESESEITRIMRDARAARIEESDNNRSWY